MPGWFSVAAPYLADIITLARPLFTRGKDKETDKVPELVAQQIAELQNAATQNAESVKLLATEMQKTLDALQTGASILESRLRWAQTLAIVSTTLAAMAFFIAVYALAR
jgi:hypothetical protein